MKKFIQRVTQQAKRTATRLANKRLKEKKQKQLKAIKAATDARLALVSRSAARAGKLGYKLEISCTEIKGLPVFKCKLVKVPLP